MIKELLYERAVKRNETIKRPEREATEKPRIFDYLRQICEKTHKFEYNKKYAPAYLISLWLSHEEDLIDIVQEINLIQFYVPDDAVYQYYYNKVPMKRRFIKYDKKNDTTLQIEQEIQEIMDEHQVSHREALMIKKHVERLPK
jgi:hypothetical protein